MKLYNFTPIWKPLFSGATIYHIPCDDIAHAVQVAKSFKETWHCDSVEISEHVESI